MNTISRGELSRFSVAVTLARAIVRCWGLYEESRTSLLTQHTHSAYLNGEIVSVPLSERIQQWNVLLHGKNSFMLYKVGDKCCACSSELDKGGRFELKKRKNSRNFLKCSRCKYTWTYTKEHPEKNILFLQKKQLRSM